MFEKLKEMESEIDDKLLLSIVRAVENRIFDKMSGKQNFKELERKQIKSRI